jgi:hypothetical protein
MTMASGLYVVNFLDSLDATQLALDMSLATHKLAAYTNTKTPNFSSDTGYSATNEVTGTGLSAGGVALSAAASGGSTSPTLTDSSGTMVYDMNDVVLLNTTLSNIRGMIEYADALAGDNNLFAVNFGSDYSTVTGTLTVQWHASGVWTLDLVP